MSNIQQLITENIDIWTNAIKPKKAAGRGRGKSSNNKYELYGIKKLRELILELAVRGLLVPQDPNDEPASVLLEKIAVEKAKLIKEKKIRNQKEVPAISDEDKPFELPAGWEWSCMAAFAEIGPRNDVPDDEKVSFIPMPLITTNYDGSHWHEMRSWAEIKKGYTHFADGDIAIAKITPCFENSKTVIFSGLHEGVGAGTTELHVARPIGEFVNRKFVLLYLKAPQFLRVGETKMTGSAGQKRVPKDFFALNPLPFPPLEEQHRIVAKVDELMALCDQLEQQTETSITAHQTLVETVLEALIARDGVYAGNAGAISGKRPSVANELDASAIFLEHFDTLFTTEHSIYQLKQTILQLAVMGKLVPQDPNDEPASELLKKIATEKEKLIKEKKIKKQKPLPEIDESALLLPKGWGMAYLQDITKVITCGMASTPEYVESGKIFLSAKNVKPYKFMPDDHKFVDEETFRKITQNAMPEKGDILLTRVGAGIGEAAIVDVDIEFAFYVSLTLVKPFLENLDSNYLLHWMNSPEGIRKSVENIYGSGVSQGNLNVKQVRGFEIPIPPLKEQHRIVTKVDELMILCDQLKQRLTDSKTTQLHLADAMAEQAVG